MAKKKAAPKKVKKVSRSSSMNLTISEGKDFVSQAQKVNKRKADDRAEQRAQLLRLITPSKPVTKKVKKAKRSANKQNRPQTQQRRKQKKTAARKTAPTVVPVVAAGRSASRASGIAPARTGSRAGQGAVRTSSKNSQIIEQELHDRLNRHGATIGQLNFSLRWWDPNDLDLHVTCPCGFHIFYGNKKCPTCGGELDIDMNAWAHQSLEPVEHVFFNTAKKGLYKFYVRYFSGPKTYGGVTGGETSRFALSLHEGLNQIFRYEDNVSNKQQELHYDYQL